jgi:hypothetical protein
MSKITTVIPPYAHPLPTVLSSSAKYMGTIFWGGGAGDQAHDYWLTVLFLAEWQNAGSGLQECWAVGSNLPVLFSFTHTQFLEWD